MFGLVDGNNFYVSCERVFQPELRKKPVVVLSNNDGCAISRSNEAKALGIPMGAPTFEYEKLFKENGVIVRSANFPLYGDMSNRVMSLLSRFTPDIEIYSIDESFLKFKGWDKDFDYKKYGVLIRNTVTQGTGILSALGLQKRRLSRKWRTRLPKNFLPKQEGFTSLIRN